MKIINNKVIKGISFLLFFRIVNSKGVFIKVFEVMFFDMLLVLFFKVVERRKSINVINIIYIILMVI